MSRYAPLRAVTRRYAPRTDVRPTLRTSHEMVRASYDGRASDDDGGAPPVRRSYIIRRPTRYSNFSKLGRGMPTFKQ